MTGPFDAITPVPKAAALDKANAVLKGRRERQQRAADNRRRLLLDAGWALMNEVGPHALNMRDLGARAGYTAGALYSYFPSKDRLIAELRQRLLNALSTRVERAVKPGKKATAHGSASLDAPRDAFERGTLAWWQALSSDPNALALLLTGHATAPSEGQSTDLLDDLVEATRACAQVIAGAGEVRGAAAVFQRQVLCLGVGAMVTQPAGLRSAALRKAMVIRFLEVVRLWRGVAAGEDNGLAGVAVVEPEVQVDLFGE